MQTQVHNVGEGADQVQDRSVDPESRNLTTGKQDYISSVEPSTPENDQSEHTTKRSMMGKMKDKANKMKTKIKSSYASKKSGDAGSDEGVEEDEDDYTSSPEPNIEPSTEELVPNSQPRQPVGKEAALEADEGVKRHDEIHGTDEYANASDSFGTHSVLKDRPFEVKEDVAAPSPVSQDIEPDYNNDPRAASDKPPSYSETLERQQNEPAVPAEQQSAGIADGIRFRDSNPSEDRVSSDDRLKGGDHDLPPVLLGGAPLVASNEYENVQEEHTPVSTGENHSDSLNGFTERSDREGSSSRDDANAHNPSWIDKDDASESGYDSKKNMASNFSGLQSDEDKLDKDADSKPVIDRAADGLSAAKDTGGIKSALAYPSDESDMKNNTELGESIQKSENSDKPRSWGEWASENVNSAKDAIVTKLGVSPGVSPTSDSGASVDRSATPQTTPENRSWTESVKSIIMPAGGNPELAEHNRSSNTSGPLSLSSTPEDTVASKPVYSEQKGVSQKIMDSAVAVKDTVSSKLGYASPSEEPALDGGKNVTRNLDSPISGGAVSAKDSTSSFFQPGEDEEALSEKISHLLSPSSIKDSIVGGFSSKTAETPDDTSVAPVKGVMSRVTDAVSSLLGSKSATNDDPQHQMHNKENSTGEQIGTNLSKPHVPEQDIIN